MSGPPGPDPAGDKGLTFLPAFVQAERRIYAYIFTLHPYRADADDLLQEVSLLLWQKYDPAAPPADFAAWGCRIAYFKVLEFRKRAGRSRVLFGQDLVDRLAESAAEQADALQLDARRDALADCVGKLPRGDRDLLQLRFADGATTATAAAAAGRSVVWTYKALARIREALFECVSRALARGDGG